MVTIKLKNVNKIYDLKKRKFEALKGINLKIHKGSCIGLIGKNGSGKSTLLKLISGIIKPTKGSIKINGKIAYLIELGIGFEAQYTGRENIYLYSSILGIPKKIIKENIQKIISFSELEDFIDVKLQKYSDGMKLRLAFSVITFLNPDIFLIDEILGVGDEKFQRKCYQFMEDKKREGKTFLISTHNLEFVANFCNNAILLDKGKIRMYEDVKKAIEDYRNLDQKK